MSATDSWDEVRRLRAKAEQMASDDRARELERQAEAMRKRLESGKGEVGAGGRR